MKATRVMFIYFTAIGVTLLMFGMVEYLIVDTSNGFFSTFSVFEWVMQIAYTMMALGHGLWWAYAWDKESMADQITFH